MGNKKLMLFVSSSDVDECESVDCGDGTQVDHIGYCECICPLSEPASTGPNCERSKLNGHVTHTFKN